MTDEQRKRRDQLAENMRWNSKVEEQQFSNPEKEAFKEGYEAGFNERTEEVEGQRYSVAVLDKANTHFKEEIKLLKTALDKKSKEIGRSEHRGNTVDYIYDKLENYGRQLSEVGGDRDFWKAECEKLKAALNVVWHDVVNKPDMAFVWQTIADAQRAHEQAKKGRG